MADREVLNLLRIILGRLDRMMASTEEVTSTATALASSATTQTETLETLTALLARQDERLERLEDGILELERIRELIEVLVADITAS